MIKSGITWAVWTLLLLSLCVSCEKIALDDDTEKASVEGKTKLRVTVSELSQTPFDNASSLQIPDSRASVPITDICGRLSIAVFKDGVKEDVVAQKKGDENYGTATFSLSEGVHTLVIIGHNGEGTATLSSPQKVTFASNQVSDTFYACEEVTVGADEQQLSFDLKRAVSMFRLEVTDTVPSTVKQLRFYYTGGSSTFDPSSGFGCVNSRQTVNLTVKPEMKVFEVYTFPHSLTDVLKITVTAINSSNEELFERVFEEVPVTLNCITTYRGKFFQGFEGAVVRYEQTYAITANPEWNDSTIVDF